MPKEKKTTTKAEALPVENSPLPNNEPVPSAPLPDEPPAEPAEPAGSAEFTEPEPEPVDVPKADEPIEEEGEEKEKEEKEEKEEEEREEEVEEKKEEMPAKVKTLSPKHRLQDFPDFLVSLGVPLSDSTHKILPSSVGRKGDLVTRVEYRMPGEEGTFLPLVVEIVEGKPIISDTQGKEELCERVLSHINSLLA